MQIEHHDLAREFPEMIDAIRVLRASNGLFATWYEHYHWLTGRVENLEEHDIPVSDFALEDMKKVRIKLKDELYHFLLAYRTGQKNSTS
ncbi:MAG: hypothetical protein BWY57_01770 [Betaproteobacteria bacterium ADurb.Bin341]|nr:MAG: hypothetical protein BWY57_01770 [Betaproteobacteria bacterium ADurb.Bin341]